jgi:N-acetylglutamate synthase-like GNAT family acetyltransferase
MGTGVRGVTVLIRRMTAEDVPVARALLSQLGYPLDDAEVRRRYEAVAVADGHDLMVAEREGRVVALCHLYVRPALDKPPEVVVQALVVDQGARGSGVGKVLMAAAEAWAEARGFVSVALASNVVRTEAHAFYEAIGYQRVATSHLFRKTLR